MRYLVFLLLIAGCADKKPEAPPKKFTYADVQGEFRSKKYPINETQSVTVFDVPDRISAHRCWVFTDKEINQSHMRCDSDPDAPMPDYAGPLAK